MPIPAPWSLPLFALATVLLFPGVADAAVYKWVDGQGVTHYANTPPPHGDFTTVETQVAPTVETEQTGSRAATGEPPTAEPEQRFTLQATNQPADAQLCRQVAEEVERLANIARIRLQTAETTKLLSDEEKRALIQERRDWHEKNCK